MKTNPPDPKNDPSYYANHPDWQTDYEAVSRSGAGRERPSRVPQQDEATPRTRGYVLPGTGGKRVGS